MAKRRTRIQVEELVAFLDVDQVALLCDVAGGRRIPTPKQFEAWKRRVLLVNDWLKGGYSVRDLAAKYQLSESAVKRVLSIARRKLLLAKLRADSEACTGVSGGAR
jgi:Mor family transcriptional regulator